VQHQEGNPAGRLFTGHGRFDQPRRRGRAMPIAMRQNARPGGLRPLRPRPLPLKKPAA
jgi:hypothetical protein